MTLIEQVERVNKLLLDQEPDDISVDSYSSYVGYKPQYIVDAMNIVFGIGAWGFEEVSSEIVATKEGGGLAVAQVKVWLKDVPFQPSGYGQARVTKGDIGDAKKGAQTDAMKKALSYFSIGNRAYQGLLSAPDGTTARSNGATRQGNAQPTNRSTQPPAPTVQVPLHDLIKRAKERAKALDLAHNPAEWKAILTYVGLADIKTVADVGKVNAYLNDVEQGAVRLQVVK